MVDNSSDSGYELVLDNRRLIVAFIVLILFCGCFFVIGFVEGKRQGYQAGSQSAAESAAKPVADEAKEPERPAVVADSGTPAVKENAEKQRLNWYKNVSGQEQKNEMLLRRPNRLPLRKKETVKPAAVSAPAALGRLHGSGGRISPAATSGGQSAAAAIQRLRLQDRGSAIIRRPLPSQSGPIQIQGRGRCDAAPPEEKRYWFIYQDQLKILGVRQQAAAFSRLRVWSRFTVLRKAEP